MPPDTVQIGPWLVSETVFSFLVPLLGVLAGGLITYLATRSADRRKWAQEKENKRKEAEREAIAQALEWIAPIHGALTSASLALGGLRYHRITLMEFNQQWPKLQSALAPLDLPPSLQVFLPPTIYERIHAIIQGLQDLNLSLVHYEVMSGLEDDDGRPTSESEDDWATRFEESGRHMAALRETLDSLNKDLRKAYLGTYE